MVDSGLTEKQRRFVEEYCVDFNASGAARRAGYAESGAHTEGFRLLKNAEILRAVEKRLEQHGMSAAEATSRMADMARADLRHFTRVDGDGRLYIDLSSERAQAMMHTIRKIRQTERMVDDVTLELKTEIELHDAKDALHKILQAHGHYTDRLDITTKGDSLHGDLSRSDALKKIARLEGVVHGSETE